MRGSAFAAKLPEVRGNLAQRTKALKRREQMMFDAVRRRDIPPILWSIITSKSGPYTATIHVSNDALRIGDSSDSFRATLSHEVAQRVADELDVVLLTPKLGDLIWSQAAVRLSPKTRLAWVKDFTIAKTHRMLEMSAIVDKAIAGRKGIVANVGKDWVTALRLWKQPLRSANYGWYAKGAPSTAATPVGGKLWQSIGLTHPISHVDYSQVVRLVRRDVWVTGPGLPAEGALFDIEVVAGDPKIASLVSHEGVLPAMRHPAIRADCQSCAPSVVAGPGGEADPGCPVECVPLPPPEPDPTRFDPDPTIAQAGITVSNVVAFGLAAAAGYWAVNRYVA